MDLVAHSEHTDRMRAAPAFASGLEDRAILPGPDPTEGDIIMINQILSVENRQVRGQIDPATLLRNSMFMHDPERCQVTKQCILAAFWFSWVIELGVVGLTVMDVESVMITFFLIMGALVAAVGLLGIYLERRRVVISRLVAMMPVVTFFICACVASVVITTGHSDYFGDGAMRAQWRPGRRPNILVIHDGTAAINVGPSQIKIKGVRIMESDKSHRKKLMMSIEILNSSPTMKINNLKLISSGLTLRDDLGNRYSKDGDETLKFESTDRYEEATSLYPDEWARLVLFFEPPIKRANHLDLTLHLFPVTPPRGLVVRIPRSEWDSVATPTVAGRQ